MCHATAPHRASESGFSLLEVLVASTVFAVGITTIAQLAALAARANTQARLTTFATLLAAQKIEQLRSLAWSFDTDGQPLSDTTTDVSVFPPAPAGGAGLSASPADALARNTAGYVDFLDARGRPVGHDATPPPEALYVRRWSIVAATANTLVLQVVVTRTGGGAARALESARVLAVKTRKAT